MEKNKEYTVFIEDMTAEGEGIGKVDGFPLFVKDALPGDEAVVRVIKAKKTYGYARLLKVLTPSKDRVEAKCPQARRCGGCQIQELSYQAQLLYKQKKVENNLRRIGGFSDINVLPTMGMEEPWRYRNKAQVPFGYDKDGKLIAGFYAGRTHDIIDMEDCLLSPVEVAQVVRIIKEYMTQCDVNAYREESHTGLIRHALVRKAFSNGQLMVCLIINGNKLPSSEILIDMLKTVPGFTTLCVNVNREKTNVILGKETKTLYGPDTIEDTIGTVRFAISPVSFFQVNPVQTQVLYNLALEYAGLTGNEVVWDLYCGIGTISLFLAQKAGHVYGVEVIPQAIEDARKNAEMNGFTNTEFFVGKAEEVLPQWYETHQEGADVIVVDPPRKGCDEACLSTIVKMEPKRVVYVSCDSATLARDLKYLGEHGYQLEQVQPVDMFGHSTHVESVVLLTRGNVSGKVY